MVRTDFMVHNEPDLHRQRNYDGEPVRPIDLIADPGSNPPFPGKLSASVGTLR